MAEKVKPKSSGYYISPNFNKMLVTDAGNVCDFAGADNFGLWDPTTMKNLSIITEIPESDSQVHAKAIAGGQGNRVVIFSADKFQVLDFDNAENPVIWEKIETVNDIVSIGTCNNNDKELFVLMKSGHLNIWDIIERKVVKVFQTIRKMYKHIQVFDGGDHIGLQEKHGLEVNIIERATGLESKLQFKSKLSRFLALNSDEFAVVFSNYIMIHSLKKGINNIEGILQADDAEENLESVTTLNEKKWLSAAGTKGVIRIWDLKKKVLLYRLNINGFGLNPFLHVFTQFYLPSLHRIAVIDNENRHFRTFNLGQFSAAPEEFQKQFLLADDRSSCINSYQSAFALAEEKQIGLLSTNGVFEGEDVVFSQVIQIVDVETGNVLGSNKVSLPDFSLLKNSVRSNGLGKVFYLMKNTLTQDTVFVEFDVNKFLALPADQKNIKEQARSLCEIIQPFKITSANIQPIFVSPGSHLERIIAPFSIVYEKDLANVFMAFKDRAGITVYDYQLKELWTKEFNNPSYVATHACMIDSNHIAFLGEEKTLEVWDIVNNEQLSSSPVDFSVSLIVCFPERILLVDNTALAHFYVQDTLDDACNIQLKKDKTIKSIQQIDDQVLIVLYSDESLQKLLLEQEKVIEIPKKVVNFMVLNKNSFKNSPSILQLSSEYFQITPLSSF